MNLEDIKVGQKVSYQDIDNWDEDIELEPEWIDGIVVEITGKTLTVDLADGDQIYVKYNDPEIAYL